MEQSTLSQSLLTVVRLDFFLHGFIIALLAGKERKNEEVFFYRMAQAFGQRVPERNPGKYG